MMLRRLASSTFRPTRPTRALNSFGSARKIWDVAALDQLNQKFGQDWMMQVGGGKAVFDWAVSTGSESVKKYLAEKPEEAIRKAARDAKLAQDDRYEELLPIRYKERDDMLQEIVKLSWRKDKFMMVSGPKQCGKSTLMNACARTLNLRDGYECIWVRCHEKEDEFLESWLKSMGLSSKDLAEVPSFEQVAALAIEGRGELSFKHTPHEDSGPEGLTAFSFNPKVKTIVFVDGIRERHAYVHRLRDLARQQSEHDYAMYVLVASDSADALRSRVNFDSRVSPIVRHPFDVPTMKEFVQFTLRRTSTQMFADPEFVVIDDEVKDKNGQTALDRLVALVKTYTWEATNAADFVLAGVEQDGSFDERNVVLHAEAFVESYSQLFGERMLEKGGWTLDKVRRVVEEFGDSPEMPVYKYMRLLGSPQDLTARNFAYRDSVMVYLKPEAYLAMKFIVAQDSMVVAGEQA